MSKIENEKSQINEDEELSDYVKELIKPENIVGEFTDTKKMFKVLLEEDKNA